MISCFRGRFKVTSPRGWRTLNGVKEYHGGLDLVALDDVTVYAIADGTVDATPYEPGGFGYYVRQVLPDGRRIYYGHMIRGSITVKAGQTIRAGDALGVMGASGRATGAHTHLEIRPAGTGKASLDICAFTGIPNAVGTYKAEEKTMAKFEDTKNHWAERDIDELVSMGIVNGVDAAHFDPDRPVTRAEAATLIRRAIKFITGK